MEHKLKKELFVLLKILALVIIIEIIIFSGCFNYLYFDKYNKEQKKIRFQDTNVLVYHLKGDVKIEYDNVPDYLHEYVDCLNIGLEQKNFSNDLSNKINNLNSYVNEFPNQIGFSYEDINSGFHISYNENDSVFAASTTKGPVAMYVYKLADEGELNLDNNYLYTAEYQSSGTGILKNQPLNTYYSLRDLTKYSIIYSDNAAYIMLINIVDKDDVSNYFKEKGAKNLFNSDNHYWLYPLFGEISAHDGNVYMKELYKYSLNNTENSNELVSYFKEASLNYIQESTNKEVAHKYGWTDEYIHDMALVFDENPYVITITSELGDDDWSEIFMHIASSIDQIHESYWNETNNYCKSLLK